MTRSLHITPASLVAIGASTGGTRALHQLLSSMPSHAPSILIVQHMPAAFTRGFAEQLNQCCPLEVREARDGDRPRAGFALVAPGDKQLRLREDLHGYFLEVSDDPVASPHRPSIDVLFHSIAKLAGRRAVGVLLTGMGDDGADGLLAMRNAGAATLVQDETTSVVFGMPREAIRRGAAMNVLPLSTIPSAIRALTGTEPAEPRIRGAPP